MVHFLDEISELLVGVGVRSDEQELFSTEAVELVRELTSALPVHRQCLVGFAASCALECAEMRVSMSAISCAPECAEMRPSKSAVLCAPECAELQRALKLRISGGA